MIRPIHIAASLALAFCAFAAEAEPVNPLAFEATMRCTTDPDAATTVPGWTIVAGSPALDCAKTLPAANGPRVAIASGPYGTSVLQRSIPFERSVSTKESFTAIGPVRRRGLQS